MDASVQVAIISSFTAIVVALIGAWATGERAARPLRARITVLESYIRDTGVDPDDL